jgi:hypothetical protein
VFSPDGEWLAFWADSSLKRIADGDGAAVTICKVGSPPSSITWRGDNILFSVLGTSIMRIPASGGQPEIVLDLKDPEYVPGRFMVVDVTARPSFAFTTPTDVPRGFGVSSPAVPRTFDILPDGRILGVAAFTRGQGGPDADQIQVVLNWFEELRVLVPAK